MATEEDIDTIVTIPQLAEKVKNLDIKIVDLSQLAKLPPAAFSPLIATKSSA